MGNTRNKPEASVVCLTKNIGPEGIGLGSRIYTFVNIDEELN